MEALFMRPRMDHPADVIPEAGDAMRSLDGTLARAGVPATTLELVRLRASQINGCSVCVERHACELRDAGESDERLFGVAAWRETPYFSDAERAALALTEAVARIADRSDPVTDEVWEAAACHYDLQQLAALVLAIASANVWNRLNVATRQLAGLPW